MTSINNTHTSDTIEVAYEQDDDENNLLDAVKEEGTIERKRSK